MVVPKFESEIYLGHQHLLELFRHPSDSQPRQPKKLDAIGEGQQQSSSNAEVSRPEPALYEAVSLVPKIFWSSNFRLVVAVVGAYVSTLSCFSILSSTLSPTLVVAILSLLQL